MARVFAEKNTILKVQVMMPYKTGSIKMVVNLGGLGYRFVSDVKVDQ